jgi:hypothetical protein
MCIHLYQPKGTLLRECPEDWQCNRVIPSDRQRHEAVITQGPEEGFNLCMHDLDVIKILERHVTCVTDPTKLERI